MEKHELFTPEIVMVDDQKWTRVSLTTRNRDLIIALYQSTNHAQHSLFHIAWSLWKFLTPNGFLITTNKNPTHCTITICCDAKTTDNIISIFINKMHKNVDPCVLLFTTWLRSYVIKITLRSYFFISFNISIRNLLRSYQCLFQHPFKFW